MRLNLLGLPGTGAAALARDLSLSTGLSLLTVDESGMDGTNHDQDPIDTIVQELTSSAAKDGYVLQGLPQSLPQAQSLDRTLALIGQPFHLAIYVNLESGTLQQRVQGRRRCSQCNEPCNIYLLDTDNPACPFCGADLVAAWQDDSPGDDDLLAAAVRQFSRLEKYYRTQNRLLKVDIAGKRQADLDRIRNALETRMRHHQI